MVDARSHSSSRYSSLKNPAVLRETGQTHLNPRPEEEKPTPRGLPQHLWCRCRVLVSAKTWVFDTVFQLRMWSGSCPSPYSHNTISGCPRSSSRDSRLTTCVLSNPARTDMASRIVYPDSYKYASSPTRPCRRVGYSRKSPTSEPHRSSTQESEISSSLSSTLRLDGRVSVKLGGTRIVDWRGIHWPCRIFRAASCLGKK